MTRRTLRRPILALAVVGSLGACAVAPDGIAADSVRAGLSVARDRDRSAAARVAGGLVAARAGVGIGCALIADAPGWRLIAPLRRFCFGG